MTTLVRTYRRFIRNTSKWLSTDEKAEVIASILEKMQLERGIKIVGTEPGNWLKMDVLEGNGLARSLYDNPEATIAIAKYDKGTITTKHRHSPPTIEYLIIISGKCCVKYLNAKGDKIIHKYYISAGEIAKVEVGVPHMVCFETETELIAIAIPKDKY